MKQNINSSILLRLFLVLGVLFVILFSMYQMFLKTEDELTIDKENIITINDEYADILRYTALDMMNISENNQGFAVVGTESDKLRADYVYNKFNEIGLSNVKREPVLLDSWNIGNVSMQFNCSCKESGPMIITQLGVYPTSFNFENSVFSMEYVEEGLDSDYIDKDVRGKGVLINNKDIETLSNAVEIASSKGASFVIYPTISKYSTGVVKVDIDMLPSPTIPVFSICYSNFTLLRDTVIEKGDSFSIIMNGYSSIKKEVNSDFVIGEIPGKNPNKYVYITANRDSIHYSFMGAHISCAELIEIAKELVQEGYKPDYTLRFMITTGSDWGIQGEGRNIGIKKYLEKLEKSELEKIQSVLVIDGSKPLNEVVLTETQVNDVNKALKLKIEKYNEDFKEKGYRFVNTINDISSVYNTEGCIWNSLNIPTVIQAEPISSDYYYIVDSSSDSAKLGIDVTHSSFLMDYYKGIIKIMGSQH